MLKFLKKSYKKIKYLFFYQKQCRRNLGYLERELFLERDWVGRLYAVLSPNDPVQKKFFDNIDLYQNENQPQAITNSRPIIKYLQQANEVFKTIDLYDLIGEPVIKEINPYNTLIIFQYRELSLVKFWLITRILIPILITTGLVLGLLSWFL